jgi:hypothetical protein
MPAKPRWWLQIPEILQALETLQTPWLDRETLEQIFGLRRRRAIELLHAFGGFQVGRTFLADRQAMIEQLRAIQSGEDFQWEHKRRRRISEVLSEARQYTQATRIAIPVIAGAPSPALPPGVHFQDGRMTIEYRDVMDLLAKFYALSQAAARDFAGFRSAVQNPSDRGKD